MGSKTILRPEENKSSDPIKFTEHSLSVDSFNHPTVFYNEDAVAAKIIELIMMSPGTYPTRPYMGIGLVSNYRYTFFDNIGTLENLIQEQINTYLPELAGASVSIGSDEDNKRLLIYITINDLTYGLSLDMSTKKLSFIEN